MTAGEEAQLDTTRGPEATVASICTRFVSTPTDELPAAIRTGLAELAVAFDADRAYMSAFDIGGPRLELAEEWCAEGIPSVAGELTGLAADVLAWWTRRIGRDGVVDLPDVEALEHDPAAHPALELLRRQSVRSLLVVPISIAGKVRGFVGFAGVGRLRTFPPQSEHLLRILASVWVDRLERARVEQALAEANDDLERSNRELEEFAYVASHDLKSPLLVVRGFLDLLARDKSSLLDEDGNLFVTTALRGAHRMERLIDDLLLFSRVGRRPLDPSPVDLAEVARSVVADLQAEIVAAECEVAVDALPTVPGDETQLRQLLQNLVANAVKFRAEGVAPQVSITAHDAGHEWIVSITDNGIGIPVDDRQRVFAMFSRLDASSERPGSGIGLAICQRVVAAHGGRIWAEDNPTGPGTRFSVALPK